MAKSKGNTVSVIEALWTARRGVFDLAEAEGERDLTGMEWTYVQAATFMIANTPAKSRNDKAMQVSISAEIAECYVDGHRTVEPIWIESLAAAAQSIAAKSPAPRRITA